MATYAKKTGNSAGLGAIYDLYDVASTTYGVAIQDNAGNAGLYSVGITATAGHEEIFAIVVIKNESGDAGTLLDVSAIELFKDYDATLGTGTAITTTDAFSINEYYRTPGNGNGGITTHPFVGIQLQANPYTVEQDWTMVINDSAATDSTRGVITSVDPAGKVSIVRPSTATNGLTDGATIASGNLVANERIIPLHRIEDITANAGVIPGGRYAAFAVKCDISDISSFADANYTLKLTHNGVDGVAGGVSVINLNVSPDNLIEFLPMMNGSEISNQAVLPSNTFARGLANSKSQHGFGQFNGKVYWTAIGNSAESYIQNATYEELERNAYYSDHNFRSIYYGGSATIEYAMAREVVPFYNLLNGGTLSIKDNSSISDVFALTITSSAANVGALTGYAEASGLDWSANLTTALPGSYQVDKNETVNFPVELNYAKSLEITASTMDGRTAYDSWTDINALAQITKFTLEYEDVADSTDKGDMSFNIPLVVYPVHSIPSSTISKIGQILNINKADISAELYGYIYRAGKGQIALNYGETLAASVDTDIYGSTATAIGSINMRLNAYGADNAVVANGFVMDQEDDVGYQSGRSGFVQDAEHITTRLVVAGGSDTEGNLSGASLLYTDGSDLGPSNFNKDYTVQVGTRPDINYRDPMASTDGFYDYSVQDDRKSAISGLTSGFELANLTISVANSIVDYGYGAIPDFSWSGGISFNFAYLPVKPYLLVNSVSSLSGTTDYNTMTSSKGFNWLNYPNDYYAWNDATKGIHSSHADKNLATPSSSTDGLFDWKLDRSFKADTFQATYTAATGIMKVDKEWNDAGVSGGSKVTCTVTSQSQLLTCSASALVHVGQQVIARGGAHAGALSSSKTYYVRAIVAGTEGTNVTQFHISQDTESGVAGSDCQVQFISPWVNTGMKVEASFLPNNGKNEHYVIGAEAAHDGDKRVFQIQKAGAGGVLANVANEGTDAGSPGKATMLKPPVSVEKSYSVYDSDYEYASQTATLLRDGDRFRIVTAFDSAANLASLSNATADDNVASDTIWTSSGTHSDTAGVVDIVNPVSGPIEIGLRKTDGSDVYSARNDAGYIEKNSIAPFGQTMVYVCALDASTLANNFYVKDFQVNLYNRGEEDVHLKKVEWVESRHVPIGLNSSQDHWVEPVTADGTAHAGAAWTVALSNTNAALNFDSPTDLYEDIGTFGADLTNSPDTRLTRDTSGFPVYCRFRASETNSNGSFYRTMKVTYYRDEGVTKKWWDNIAQVWNEKPTQNRREWHSYIVFGVTIASSPSISITDADGYEVIAGSTTTFTPTAV